VQKEMIAWKLATFLAWPVSDEDDMVVGFCVTPTGGRVEYCGTAVPQGPEAVTLREQWYLIPGPSPVGKGA